MIKDLSDTKLPFPKILLLGILSGIGGCIGAVTLLLIQDSNAFARLKQAKIIDRLLATLMASISIPLYILALIFATSFILLYLFFHYRNTVKLQFKELAEEYYKLIKR